MRRRDAMILASLAMAGGCRRESVAPAAVPKPPTIDPAPAAEPREGAGLKLVEVDPLREIRTTTGLRPYRPEGYVVRREEAGSKVLIHNYGHGGGGMTLSWGTSIQAVRLAGPLSGVDCAVVGGGVMGLSTARLLQLRGARVTLYARALPPDTTSNASGAQWWPFSVFDPGRRSEAFGRQFVEAARLSFEYFQPLVGPRWGIRWLPNFYLNHRPHGSGWLSGPGSALHEMQIGFEDFGPGEHAFPLPHVRRFFTMMIEPATYLATLLGDVQAAGVGVVIRDLKNRDELLGLPHERIFNCTGLGAGPLTGDTTMVPVKGQLSILMPQPGIDYNLIHGDYYMFPRTDGIVLGGTYVHGDTDPTADPRARQRVLSAHRDFFERFRLSQLAAG